MRVTVATSETKLFAIGSHGTTGKGKGRNRHQITHEIAGAAHAAPLRIDSLYSAILGRRAMQR